MKNLRNILLICLCLSSFCTSSFCQTKSRQYFLKSGTVYIYLNNEKNRLGYKAAIPADATISSDGDFCLKCGTEITLFCKPEQPCTVSKLKIKKPKEISSDEKINCHYNVVSREAKMSPKISRTNNFHNSDEIEFNLFDTEGNEIDYTNPDGTEIGSWILSNYSDEDLVYLLLYKDSEWYNLNEFLLDALQCNYILVPKMSQIIFPFTLTYKKDIAQITIVAGSEDKIKILGEDNYLVRTLNESERHFKSFEFDKNERIYIFNRATK